VSNPIYGNLKGLKPSQMKQLQRLYQQRIPGDRLTTPEFAQRIAAISTDISQAVSVYLDRRGRVIRVGVGTPRQTQIPLNELPRYGSARLSGIRCVTTQLKPGEPGTESLTSMAMQRLDAMVLITLTGEGFRRRGGGDTGYIKQVYIAHLVPNTEAASWSIATLPDLEALEADDFIEMVESLEAEFEREFVAQQVDNDRDRVLLVGLKTDDITTQQFEDDLAEAGRLVDTAGGIVLQTLRQKRSRPHPQTVFGAGKVDELAMLTQNVGANLVVVARDLSPAQERSLERACGVRVVDRTEVILDIFAQRAQSGAGKLQVELAQLEYMLPRLVGRGQAMSRQGGGIGTRGPGETKLETERRAIQRRISRLQQEVTQLQAHRSRLRQKRQAHDVPTIALVGYTNAGKSTLLNTLSNSDIYAADQLFATLDPTTRRVGITDDDAITPRQLLLTDTVGFIHDLPPALVDAFRATLEEVTEADALLHVVDLSHPAWIGQIQSVMGILSQMPTIPGPILLVFNKVDRVSSKALERAKDEYPQAAFISAVEGFGLTTLRQRLLQLVDYVMKG
jgi:GTP-binding protein HflX